MALGIGGTGLGSGEWGKSVKKFFLKFLINKDKDCKADGDLQEVINYYYSTSK
jgi:hypothetical protein